MTGRRQVMLLSATLAALGVALPASAQASPLLSGYGGPGQGSQAILGSALVNGGGGGSGSGGGSDSGGGSGEASGSSALAASSSAQRALAASQAAGAVQTGRAPAGAHGSPAGGQGAKGHSGARAAGPSRVGAQAGVAAREASELPAGTYTALERSAAPHQPALGLSGGDLLAGVLVLCALVLTGLLTRRLTRGAQQRDTHGRQAGAGG